ncbi:MAG: GAF domain-containing protein [Chloroflexi bacterium]|nr:GAF domain-containing protein [Chloroflexota bacterium]
MRLEPRSLSGRIVTSVALGLTFLLLVFGAVVLWTVDESAEAAYAERVTLAQAFVRRVDDVLRYALVTLEREAVGLRINPGQPLTDHQIRHLDDLHRQIGIFTVLSMTDTLGSTVWTYPQRADIRIGAPLTHPSVQLVLRTDRPQITELPSPTGEDTVFACLAVPLHDENGRLVGALMAEIDPGHPALTLLPSEEGGDGVHVSLMNAAGRVLAGSEVVHAGVGPAHRALLDDLIVGQVAGYRVHQPPPETGIPAHLVAYAPVWLLPSWGVVVEQVQDVVLALPYRLQQRLVLFGLITLLFVAVLAWYDVRRVVGPLQYLTSVASRFAGGQLDEPVYLERADELGILARAFELMRQRLRASLAEIEEWNRELERRVAARTAEVERRNRELAHLNAIAGVVSGSLEARTMLQRTLNHVVQITGVEAGCFWVSESNGSALVAAAQFGLPGTVQAERVCIDRCLCGRAARLNQVLIGPGAGIDPEALACQAAGLQSAVAVPLPAGEQVQGVLFLGSKQPDYFPESGVATLAAIGRQVGIALANARLYESLQARERERAELLQLVIDGQEEERRRLAQELHDETSQALASLQLGLERLAAGSDPGHARRLAAQLQQVAAETLAEVHRLAIELRPSVLDDVGLVAAIERYLQEYRHRWGLTTDFAPVGVDAVRLIPAAETAVYRIVQAALTNVAQHAQAQHVSVLLQERDGRLVVVVEDDGRGFDLAAVHAAPLERRLGLAGMEERASLIGATLTIETGPGTGTSVFLEVPLEPNYRK